MSQDNEILVKVEGVSKKFCRDLKKSLWYGVKDVASELLPFGRQKSEVRGQGSEETSEALSEHSTFNVQNSKFPSPHLRDGEFWAVKDVSFELRRGECIGLIGHNGAGKTTLLKMLNGLIKPDSGTIEIRGRVGALIALGAGFNPILTGRENIYVNASILGLNKDEIKDKLEDIINFSEIRDFIDSPVQSYSSGMQVRLGFAVATALNPDVLILDEVLAVGDRRFRSKCMTRISKLLENCAVMFVSHSSADVQQICDSVLWLDKGTSNFLGNVETGLRQYSKAYQSYTQSSENILPPVSQVNLSSTPKVLKPGESILLDFKVELDGDIIADYFVGALVAETGETIAQFHAPWNKIHFTKGGNHFAFKVKTLRLAPGQYTINALCCSNGGKRVLFHLNQVTGFDVECGAHLWSSYQPETCEIQCK